VNKVVAIKAIIAKAKNFLVRIVVVFDEQIYKSILEGMNGTSIPANSSYLAICWNSPAFASLTRYTWFYNFNVR
jgi:hypothetical protein